MTTFQFILNQASFFASLFLVFFLPGYFLLKALQGKNKIFNVLEKSILSFVFSILSVDFLMLVMNKIGISFSRWSLIGALLVFCAINFAIYKIRKKDVRIAATSREAVFSRRQNLIIFGLIFATIFIKTIYLSGAVLPSATDLGHHMYWSKLIATQGLIPAYEKADITTSNTLAIAPIADFIVGEHLIFAAIGIISGLSFVSAFPVLTIFLIHLVTIAALFMLALEIFKQHEEQKNIAIITLLFTGPLFAISSPQMKFVSGGVIGNTIGNLLIPVVIYFLVRALVEKSASFLALTFFVGLGMAYTHHLSTFVFIFIFLFSGLYFLATNLREKLLWKNLKDWFLISINPAPILMLVFSAIFVFLIYTPTYLNSKAIDTAVGTPEKATRLGLTLTELSQTAGEVRLALAFFAIFLFLTLKNIRKDVGIALAAGWLISLTVMSLRPQWLFIDIPSNRIASYIVFPVAMLSAFLIAKGFSLLKNKTAQQFSIHPLFLICGFFLLIAFSLQTGQKDNTDLIDGTDATEKVVQTYHSADYLAQNTDASDIVLKDHNYLAADAWIKLSFMRGYNNPLSRGYFKRYEDETKKREMCTFQMITTPSSAEAKECFLGTSTDFIMINPNFDSIQFKKNRDFWQVYASNDVGIFYRKAQ